MWEAPAQTRHQRYLPMLTALGKVVLSVSTVNPLLRFVTLYSAAVSFKYSGLCPASTCEGSNFDMPNAVVPVSTLLNILYNGLGLLRPCNAAKRRFYYKNLAEFNKDLRWPAYA